MRNTLCLLAVLVVIGAAPCAARERIPLYLGYGYFFPTAESTRDATGAAWPQFTFGRLETKYPDKWVGTWDLASFRRNDESDALMIALTAGVRRGIGPERADGLQPYAALRAGPFYGKVSDAPDGDGSRIGLNANASLGVLIQKRYFVEGRYDCFGRIAGLQLDGFSVWAGVKVLDL